MQFFDIGINAALLSQVSWHVTHLITPDSILALYVSQDLWKSVVLQHQLTFLTVWEPKSCLIKDNSWDFYLLFQLVQAEPLLKQTSVLISSINQCLELGPWLINEIASCRLSEGNQFSPSEVGIEDRGGWGGRFLPSSRFKRAIWSWEFGWLSLLSLHCQGDGVELGLRKL